MRKITILVVVVVMVFVVALGAAHAVRAGQPNQSCQQQPLTPGNASTAPGSAFNTSGVAGTHYAGQQPQNSNNPHAVSQYDVACAQVSAHQP